MVAGRPAKDSSSSSSLTSLVPRQVMLDSKASAASPPRMEGGAKKKTKNKDVKSGSKEQKISRIRSIAALLDTEGFTETLSAFLSELHLQLLGCKRGSSDLEDILTKYLNSSEVSKKGVIDCQREQDDPDCIQSLKVMGQIVSDTHEDHIHKKKRKKSREIDVASTKPNEPGIDGIANVVKNGECLNESKTKKKKNSSMCSSISEDSDMLAEAENKRMFVEEKLNNLRSLIQNNPVLLEKPDDKPKEKKMTKKKSVAPCILVDVLEPVVSEESKEMPKEIFECDETVTNSKVSEHAKDPLTEMEHKSKGRKKRKNISITESSAKNSSEQLDDNQEDKNKFHSIVKNPISKVSVSNAQSIKLKKRKGNGSVEKISTNISIVAQEQMSEQHNIFREHEDKSNGCDATKDTSSHELNNEKYEKNNEGFFSSPLEKVHRKNSDEPKTINAFQRVKIDEVKFANEKLQDNSYWAKGGADTGYGAKAQEILGQVRGRDFRHEKTKKKRGSYRGGQIDMQSHSIKFSYSDDEE